MFGWEFPPHQAGGLATATLGLVKGLLSTGVQVTLVVPFFRSTTARFPALRLVSTAGFPTVMRQVRVPSPLTDTAASQSTPRRVSPGTPPPQAPAAPRPTGIDLFHEIERFSPMSRPRSPRRSPTT